MKNEKRKTSEENNNDLPGYPSYPAGEDIYKKYKEEAEINPDDLTPGGKEPNLGPNVPNEKDFTDTQTGEDLDVPGSELDDDMEERGDEDEENNYYSLGDNNQDNTEASGDKF